MKSSELTLKRWLIASGAVMIVLLLLALGGIYQLNRANALSQHVENQYMSSFNDLSDCTKDISVLLNKAMLSNSPAQLSTIASEISMKTASAKTCLAQLPLSDVNLENTSKFLAQTGDYVSTLSSKVINNGQISDKEYATLSELCEYAETTNNNLEDIRNKLYNRELNFDISKNVTAYANDSDKNSSVGGNFEELEKEFQEYPSLVYDGPFSEHIEKMEPEFLKFLPQITEEKALEAATNYLGKDRAQGLSLESESSGSIECYIFNSDGNNKDRSVSIAITKQGGKVLWMLDSRVINESKISVEEAELFASRFLQGFGFNNMKESYYEKTGNVATINFAYKQGDVVLYSDLIKVKVALDTGEIVGCETRGYLMSHKERSLPVVKISPQEARTHAAKHLSVSSVEKALIPLESKREVLCYELKGTFRDKNFLIYVNAQTGEDEKILMLVESPEGIFTL